MVWVRISKPSVEAFQIDIVNVCQQDHGPVPNSNTSKDTFIVHLKASLNCRTLPITKLNSPQTSIRHELVGDHRVPSMRATQEVKGKNSRKNAMSSAPLAACISCCWLVASCLAET